MDKENLIEQAKSLAAAMFDPLGNGESDNMIMSNRDAQNAAEIIYGLIALLEDDNPPWTAKDFATAVPFQEIVKMHLSKQAEHEHREPTHDEYLELAKNADIVAAHEYCHLNEQEMKKAWVVEYGSQVYAKAFLDGFESAQQAFVKKSLTAQEQEPVGVVVQPYGERHVQVRLYEQLPVDTKLYAAPVRTKDLTDDEICKANKTELPDCQDLVDFARAVIAADREKNK